LERKDFGALLTAIVDRGYRLTGPKIKDNAIVYADVAAVEDLPVGWSDRQEAGTYRLRSSHDKRLFDYVVGPYNLRRLLTPAERVVLEAERSDGRFSVAAPEPEEKALAVLGVRPCDLAALASQDKALAGGPYVDTEYKQRRERLLIVAVNCTRPGGTCFCTSMGTGPRAESGFDLALTELVKGSRHFFVVTVGSPRGEDLLAAVPHEAASEEDLAAERKALDKAASSMGRKLTTAGLRDTLDKHFDSPHWEELAERCLTCGNCTMVCPTCFCTNVVDTTDLGGDRAVRHRLWDSCFNVEFSYIHGGSVRTSEMSRYRQWMMHKLCYWLDQFGTLGCVGCGRCITWCPVGIDITEEARAFQEMK